ncbi:MAG: hypothetical protein ACU85V_11995 [Gammaproteobacteria bacterium]
MKNRSWFTLALDFCGIAALIGAALALGAALWFSASVAEGLLLAAFSYCLMASVGIFLAARTAEIVGIMRRPAAPAEAQPAAADNVETLPAPEALQRAA